MSILRRFIYEIFNAITWVFGINRCHMYHICPNTELFSTKTDLFFKAVKVTLEVTNLFGIFQYVYNKNNINNNHKSWYMYLSDKILVNGNVIEIVLQLFKEPSWYHSRRVWIPQRAYPSRDRLKRGPQGPASAQLKKWHFEHEQHFGWGCLFVSLGVGLDR